ncbi:hypothetical protein JOB18_013799 [Solea senegalensis]|uniref:Uncharacterized protein n=1 Tax=Solea senegalensis TaxID=28829 RepID=A0AAV6QNU4_SOLSE|nr:hypothetical protein JOB18_013799 [Solea senegalensis]
MDQSWDHSLDRSQDQSLDQSPMFARIFFFFFFFFWRGTPSAVRARSHEENCGTPWMMMKMMMMPHNERRFSKPTASPSAKGPQSPDHQSTIQADVQTVSQCSWSKTSRRTQAKTPA